MEHTSKKAWVLHPHVQTSLLINECVNLSMSVSGGYIKLTEPHGARKDRYTCLSYANYYASFLDSVLLREEDDDEGREMIGLVQVLG